MTVVLVHGNPETDSVWDPLVEVLDRDDVVRLSPPGFGAPLPEGWPATALAYRDWLEEELVKIEGPIDLVGHDWGGAHTINVVMHRPELVRSWASDTLGCFDPEYTWHDRALLFQNPTEGEAAVDAWMNSPLSERTQYLVDRGMPLQIAAKIAAGQGPQMGRAILSLYRSAAQPAMAEAGQYLPKAAAQPGLSLLATEDPLVGSEMLKRRAAARAGAVTVLLEGLGHWWMLEDPARGAAALTEFWASLN
ncbi:alpha/beta fold hydrolase [Mycolicibacterium mucogenicum]|uniref:alpha/beta fold hydrolase n=1 Tax=Mycolicibacterium mucogenicum TaxID=56689 RepID=UPI0009F5CFCD|nr:alpha/beta hydrolase [Mycolicibacterium mucogenicum]